MAEACVRTVPIKEKSIASVAGPAPSFDRLRPYSISLSRVSFVSGSDAELALQARQCSILGSAQLLPVGREVVDVLVDE